MGLHIRRAAASDSASLSYICLITGDAGVSAENLYNNPELVGSIYAVPYVHTPTAFGFVLEDDETQQIVGYLLGTLDTLTFCKKLEENWWPPLRQKYPLESKDNDAQRTDADQHVIKLFHFPETPNKACIEFSSAHIHINLVPQYQRQGWGRRLIDEAVQYMYKEGLTGVWLGMDPRNKNARRFYERLGFKEFPGAPDSYVGLRFEDWQK